MMITFINMTVKHNNLLNLIIGCLYVSFFGFHYDLQVVCVCVCVLHCPVRLIYNGTTRKIIYKPRVAVACLTLQK